MSIGYRRQAIWKNTFFVGGFLLVMGLLSALLFSGNTAYAAPGKINYQGRLTDATGAPEPDGDYNMTFRIYDATSGGTLIWSETRETTNRVSVTDGQFNVQLGDVAPIPSSAFASDTRYFEVELPTPATATCSTAACGIYTEGPMTPRQPVASSAYALNSDTLDGIDSSSFVQVSSNNSYTGTNLFKNTSDSTSAFGVQTAASVSLMNVDTTASKVTIGTNGAGGAAITTLGNGNVGVGNAAPGYTLDVGGNALFKNVSDTATAFQVQSATAVSMFTVDTVSSRVVVGSSTPDATGTILVLDTKNTVGDPTGVDGAMYYNSNAAKFRCYEAGAWSNCLNGNSYKTSSAMTTSTLYSNITGLSFYATASTKYSFRAIINYTAAATTTGSRWSVNGPALRNLSLVTRSPLTTTTERVTYTNAYDSGTASASSAFLTNNVVTVEGTIDVTANGTVILRFATGVSGSAIGVTSATLVVW